MAGKITQYIIASGAADASGDATATTEKILRGKLKAISLIYDASSAAGTDVTVDHLVKYGTQTVTENLLTIGDANTSAKFYPRAYAEDTAGADLTYDGINEIPTEFVLFGPVKITIANQTEGKAVTAILHVEEY